MIYVHGKGPIYISNTSCEEGEDCPPVENTVHFSNYEGQNHAVLLSCADDAIHIPITECDECEAYEQRVEELEEKIGDLSDLDTTDKSTIVAAINEIYNSGGGGGVTYVLSMAGNVITLTGSDSSTSSVTLPVYDGGVTP